MTLKYSDISGEAKSSPDYKLPCWKSRSQFDTQGHCLCGLSILRNMDYLNFFGGFEDSIK